MDICHSRISKRAFLYGMVLTVFILLGLTLLFGSIWSYNLDAEQKALGLKSALIDKSELLQKEIVMTVENANIAELQQQKKLSSTFKKYDFLIAYKDRKDINYNVIYNNLDDSLLVEDDTLNDTSFDLNMPSDQKNVFALPSMPLELQDKINLNSQRLFLGYLKKDQAFNDSLFIFFIEPETFFSESFMAKKNDFQNIRAINANDVIIFDDHRNKSHSYLYDYLRTDVYKFDFAGQALELQVKTIPDQIFFLLVCCGLFSLATALILFVFTTGSIKKHNINLLDEHEKQNNHANNVSQKLEKIERDFINLKKSEAEYRNLLDSISDIIFETDETSEIVFLNDRWNRLTNIDAWRITGQQLKDIFHEKDSDAVNSLFKDYVSGKRLHTKLNCQLKVANKKYKTVELQFSMIRIPGDQKVRIVGSMRDIEDRVKSEQALREAEFKYRTMVEKSLGGIYRSSPEGKFISANPAMAKILGYDSPEDFMESIENIRTDFYADQAVRKGLLDEINQNDGATDLEARVKKKNGDVIWVSETCRPVKDDNGNLIFYEGTMVDITRRKETEEQLKRAMQHSDMSNRAKSEFLANMSHELRTPLNAIIGFSEILRDELFGPLGQEEYKDYAKDINNSGVHLLQIINDILDVSKIEAGKRELSESRVSIREISESAFIMVKPKADEASIFIDNLIPDDFPTMQAEELAIKQILINLMNNAVKFTPEGGKITMRADILEDEFCISVKDTGIGMKKEHIEKALSAFGQINTQLNKKESGTGLGLTLVQQLTELHGGHIVIDSEPDRGTTVSVYFPKWRLES